MATEILNDQAVALDTDDKDLIPPVPLEQPAAQNDNPPQEPAVAPEQPQDIEEDVLEDIEFLLDEIEDQIAPLA
jgi:hypothetical protein